MANIAKWFVIHTYSGYENKVATNIETVVENRSMQDQILEVKIPTETVVEPVVSNAKKSKKSSSSLFSDGSEPVREKQKTREVERKIFPGYVFVKVAVDVEEGEYVMSDDAWYVIRNTRGVTGFVGPESKPVPLSEREVEQLGVEVKQIEVLYAVGDMVNIMDGPFSGMSGRVEKIETDKNLVSVTISMFGRDTPVEFELDQVEPAID